MCVDFHPRLYSHSAFKSVKRGNYDVYKKGRVAKCLLDITISLNVLKYRVSVDLLPVKNVYVSWDKSYRNYSSSTGISIPILNSCTY